MVLKITLIDSIYSSSLNLATLAACAATDTGNSTPSAGFKTILICSSISSLISSILMCSPATVAIVTANKLITCGS